MNLPLVIIAGVFGSYLLGSALEAFAWRGAGQWGDERRGRLLAQMRGWDEWLRRLDFVSFALILLCVIRLNGVLRSIPLIYAPWGLVVAVALMALERMVRAWLTWRLFSAEGEEGAGPRAFLAALATTVLQVALALWVGWWVFKNVRVIRPGGSSGGPTTSVQTPPGTSQTGHANTGTQETLNERWMTEEDALQYTGKDQAYLDLLARHVRGMFAEPLRGEVEGRTVYRRDYLEQLKMGGWPPLEEMRNAQPHGDPPTPKPPKPLTEEELLKE